MAQSSVPTLPSSVDENPVATNATDLKPRPYQDELLEVTLARNTIIYLPTGAGKTFIALMAMRRMSADLTRSLADGGRRSVFLVNTVVLANQQMECIRQATSLRVAKYTGDMNVDAWRRDDWANQFETNQVLVATCQIILDVVRHGFVQLSQINLMIFDECHHGREDHPMHQLMRLYSMMPPHSDATPRPRIIGLTGMLIGASVKPHGVLDELDALEATFHSTIATVRTMDDLHNVMVYSTKPQELILKYPDPTVPLPLELRVRAQIAALVVLIEGWPVDGTHIIVSRVQLSDQFQLGSTTKWMRSLLNDFVYQMEDLGLYGASVAILAVIVELELKKRSAGTQRLRSLMRAVLCAAERIRHQLVVAVYEFSDDDQPDDVDTIMCNSSGKMVHFLTYMRNYFQEQQRQQQCITDTGDVGIKALVFVHRRHSAKCVYHVLQRYANAVGLALHADFMVGANNRLPDSVESLIEAKRTHDVVARFRRNDLNVIVSSSVLEEGIDLQDCNLVVSLDAPATFRSYVQSMGRARMSTSRYVLLTPYSKHAKQMLQLAEWRQVQEQLRTYLIGRSHDRTAPTAETIGSEFGPTLMYHTASGALLEEVSAVQLLNRYASGMPNDAFTVSALNWRKVLTGGAGDGRRQLGEASKPVLISVRLRLPVQSKVKEEIVGDPRGSLQAAKRAAAFRACVRLHEAGELNDNLMPINGRRCLQVVSDNYFAHWRRHDHDTVRDPGSRKSIRPHQIIWPAALHKCNPMRSLPTCLLYMIDMEPAFQPPTTGAVDVTIAGVHRLLSQPQRRRFGLLTANRLPAIGLMKLFQHYGAIDVSIRAEPLVMHTASICSPTLRLAHECLFGDLLDTSHPFMVAADGADESGAAAAAAAVNDYLIVPCTSAGHIDTEAVTWLTQMPEQNATCASNVPPSEELRRQTCFNADTYVGAVVTPWYRTDLASRYVVTRVCRELTPASPVNAADSGYLGRISFAQFVAQKYVPHRAVNAATAFMLEVRGISQNLNRLTPGAQMDGSKAPSGASIVQYLIPEMCRRFNVPADLWLQATMLPSVLHRLLYAMHADELRVDINKALDIEPPPGGYQPEPLLEQLPPASSAVNAAVTVATPQLAPPSTQNATPDPEPASAGVLVDPWTDLVPVPTIADPWTVDDLTDTFEQLTPAGGDRAVQTQHAHHLENCIAHPWDDIDQPVDLMHEIANIYPVDLLYAEHFVHEHQVITSKLVNLPDALQLGTPAVAMPAAEFCAIRLLDVTRHTATVGPSQRDLMAALTTSRCADIIDGERLEVLGDAFLKFAASLFLVRRHPDWHEGHLSVCKGQLVSNKNLFYLAKQRQLGGRMKVHLFSPKSTWLAPAMRVPNALVADMVKHSLPPHLLHGFHVTSEERRMGVVTAERIADFLQPRIGANTKQPAPTNALGYHQLFGYQHIADKVLADAVEACLGATLRAVGIERTIVALRHWGVLPASAISKSAALDLLVGPFANPRIRPDCSQRDIDELLPNYPLLERQLTYEFRDRAYLLQALTHPSFPANQMTGCYQQLEFIGDAVLDMLVTAHIYERCPDKQPGQLTDLRSALVNNVTLACVCVRHHIQRFLLAQNATLADQVATFVEFQRGHGHRVTDEVLLLRTDEEVRMGEAIDVPKTLGDVIEALIGAVFLDSGNDLKRTWQVVWHLLGGEVEAFVRDTPLQVVRRLGEWTEAAAKYGPPFVDGEVVMITVQYTCRHQLKQAHGFGRSAAKAKLAAAKVALNDLLGE